MKTAHPNVWTISEHCIERYLERVAPPVVTRRRDARQRAHAEIAAALNTTPVCVLLSGGKVLLGVKNVAGHPFMVHVDLPRREAITCGPVWFWHESRHYWREQGIDPKRLSKGKPKRKENDAETISGAVALPGTL